jgi:hypothetical protein
MRGLIVIVPLLALVVIVAGIAALASLFPLQGVRDIAIVVLAALWVLNGIVLLMSVLVLTWVVLVIKDGVVPVLEKATSTLDTVQGTAQFLGESVVNPVVKAASAAAWIRGAMLRIVGRKRR